MDRTRWSSTSPAALPDASVPDAASKRQQPMADAWSSMDLTTRRRFTSQTLSTPPSPPVATRRLVLSKSTHLSRSPLPASPRRSATAPPSRTPHNARSSPHDAEASPDALSRAHSTPERPCVSMTHTGTAPTPAAVADQILTTPRLPWAAPQEASMVGGRLLWF